MDFGEKNTVISFPPQKTVDRKATHGVKGCHHNFPKEQAPSIENIVVAAEAITDIKIIELTTIYIAILAENGAFSFKSSSS